MKEEIWQEERERQNKNTGVNRARSEGTSGEGRYFSEKRERDRNLSDGICKLIKLE